MLLSQTQNAPTATMKVYQWGSDALPVQEMTLHVKLKLNGSLHLGHAVLKISFNLLLYFLIILSQSYNTMSGRQSNKLPSNLPQLQNLIKRDPQSYVDEVSVAS